MERILEMLLEFKELLFVGIVIGVVFLSVFSVRAGDIGWKKRNIRFFGVFTGLQIQEMLWLSVGAVRILFIVCLCVFTQRLNASFTIFYLVLSLLAILTFFKPGRILIEIVNTVAVYASLTALNVLFGYYQDVNNHSIILTIYILLSLFTILYSVYFYMRGISNLVSGKIVHEAREAGKK
ncbi:MAG: hypothetical protein LBN34_05220 [Clostridiales Family XIII bacterium]|jgi:hypothetical protein|nr:hypothetical protein [Clostridiales Family XIII bacterium]